MAYHFEWQYAFHDFWAQVSICMLLEWADQTRDWSYRCSRRFDAVMDIFANAKCDRWSLKDR